MIEFSGLTLYSANTKILAHFLKHTQSTSDSGSSKSIYEPEIQDEAFYHGFMSRVEADICLKHHGQFLVRRIEENNEGVSLFRIFIFTFNLNFLSYRFI